MALLGRSYVWTIFLCFLTATNGKWAVKPDTQRLVLNKDDPKLIRDILLPRLLQQKDFTQLNSILDDLELEIETGMGDEPLTVLQEIPGTPFLAELKVVISDIGNCYDLGINDDIQVGGTMQPKAHLPGPWHPPYFHEPVWEQFDLQLDVFDLQLECELDLKVTIEKCVGIPCGGLNTPPQGTEEAYKMRFRTETAILSDIVIEIFSRDFVRKAPEFARNASCVSDVGTLTYDGTELGNVLLLGDLTDQVLDTLRNDPSYVEDPTKEALCDLAHELAAEISTLLVENEFTSVQDSILRIPNPFNDTGAGKPALYEEQKIYSNGPIDADLYDLSNRDDFLVKMLISEDPENDEQKVTKAIHRVTAEDKYNQTDPLVTTIANLLNITLTRNDPTSPRQYGIEDLDVLELVTDLLNITLDSFTFETEVQNIKINAEASVSKLLFSLDPPNTFPDVTMQPAVGNLAPGKHTVYLDPLRFGDIRIDVEANLKLTIDNTINPIQDNDFLKNPFYLSFDEDFSVDFQYDGLEVSVAALVAFEWDKIMDLHFGPLLENIFDCIISIFYVPPRLTAFVLDHEDVRLSLGGFTDGIFVLLRDLLNIMFPLYRSVLPRAIEYVVDSAVIDEELIEASTCPLVNENDYNMGEVYNFSEGVVKQLSDMLDEELVGEVTNAVDWEDNGIEIFQDPIEITLELPSFRGWYQNVTFSLYQLRIEGLQPPSLHELTLFYADPNSEYFPQEVLNVLDLGEQTNPFKIYVGLKITSSQAERRDNEKITQPVEVYAQNNDIKLAVEWGQIKVLLDLLLLLSKYDVESTRLGDFINLDCWLSKLDYPGGITNLDVNLLMPKISFDCQCNNPYMDQIEANLNKPGAAEDLTELLNDLLQRLGNAVENAFADIDEWTEIQTNARIRCENSDEDEVRFSRFGDHGHHEDWGGVISFLGLFVCAMSIPLCCLAAAKRKQGKSKIKPEDSDEGEHLEKALWNNPLVPKPARVLVPTVLVANIILFVIGDTGSAVRLGLAGQLAGIPIEADVIELSVISSVSQLWKAEAYILAVVLAGFSIIWPYVKLFSLGYAWFAPPRFLKLERRGKLVSALDILGKWSFVEFHFLIFVLIAFQINGGAPNPPFLDGVEIFEIEIVITPLISLFLFCFAIVVSLIIGNTIMLYHYKIADANRREIRRNRLEIAEKRRVETTSRKTYEIDIDQFKIGLKDWWFTGYPVNDNTSSPYKYRINKFAIGLMLFMTVMTALFLLLSASLDAIIINIYGLFALLIEWGDGERDLEYSAIDLLKSSLEIYSGNVTIYFAALVFIITLTIIPLIQVCLLICMVTMKFDLNVARKVYEAHHFIITWCCVDVFVVAIAFTVLELRTVASGLTRAISYCTFIGEFMEDVLYPLDLISEEDAKAACLDMEPHFGTGAYIAIICIFILNVTNMIAGKSFKAYIEDRERIEPKAATQSMKNSAMSSKARHHEILNKFGLIAFHVTTPGEGKLISVDHRATSNPQFRSDNVEASMNAFLGEEGSPPPRPQTRPQTLSFKIPTNPEMEKQLRKKEADLTHQSAVRAYKQLHPSKKAKRVLVNFLKRVDPERVGFADALVEEALSRPDGWHNLSQKLLDKYGATISIDTIFGFNEQLE